MYHLICSRRQTLPGGKAPVFELKGHCAALQKVMTENSFTLNVKGGEGDERSHSAVRSASNQTNQVESVTVDRLLTRRFPYAEASGCHVEFMGHLWKT